MPILAVVLTGKDDIVTYARDVSNNEYCIDNSDISDMLHNIGDAIFVAYEEEGIESYVKVHKRVSTDNPRPCNKCGGKLS